MGQVLPSFLVGLQPRSRSSIELKFKLVVSKKIFFGPFSCRAYVLTGIWCIMDDDGVWNNVLLVLMCTYIMDTTFFCIRRPRINICMCVETIPLFQPRYFLFSFRLFGALKYTVGSIQCGEARVEKKGCRFQKKGG